MTYDPVTYWKNREVPAPNELPKFAEEYIRSHIKDAEMILDYGTGIGRMLDLYNDAGIVFGMDIINRYKEQAIRRGDIFDFQYVYTTEDIRDFGGIMFDCAIASKVLLHVKPENIEHIMRSLARVSDKVIVYDTVAECEAPHNFNHDFGSIVDMQEPLFKGRELLFWYT